MVIVHHLEVGTWPSGFWVEVRGGRRAEREPGCGLLSSYCGWRFMDFRRMKFDEVGLRCFGGGWKEKLWA